MVIKTLIFLEISILTPQQEVIISSVQLEFESLYCSRKLWRKVWVLFDAAAIVVTLALLQSLFSAGD